MPISCTVKDRIAEIVFDVPPVNAFDSDTWMSIPEIIADAGRNPDVNCILIRAEGRGFCGGVDIKEMQATEGYEALIGANKGCYAAFAAVYECAVPVIAAVHGFCLGGGIGLVGNADVIIASEDATFGPQTQGETRFGSPTTTGAETEYPYAEYEAAAFRRHAGAQLGGGAIGLVAGAWLHPRWQLEPKDGVFALLLGSQAGWLGNFSPDLVGADRLASDRRDEGLGQGQAAAAGEFVKPHALDLFGRVGGRLLIERPFERRHDFGDPFAGEGLGRTLGRDRSRGVVGVGGAAELDDPFVDLGGFDQEAREARRDPNGQEQQPRRVGIERAAVPDPLLAQNTAGLLHHVVRSSPRGFVDQQQTVTHSNS